MLPFRNNAPCSTEHMYLTDNPASLPGNHVSQVCEAPQPPADRRQAYSAPRRRIRYFDFPRSGESNIKVASCAGAKSTSLWTSLLTSPLSKTTTDDKQTLDRIEIFEAVLYLCNLGPGRPPEAPCVGCAVTYDGPFPCYRCLRVVGFKNNTCAHGQVEDPGAGECEYPYCRSK